MDYRNLFCVSPCVLWLEEPVAIAMVLQSELASVWLPAFCLAGCSIMAAMFVSCLTKTNILTVKLNAHLSDVSRRYLKKRRPSVQKSSVFVLLFSLTVNKV